MIMALMLMALIRAATETADRRQLMGPKELAEYIGVPLATVYAMNHRRTGPKRLRVGKYVRYRRSDVDAWLDQQEVATPIGADGGGS